MCVNGSWRTGPTLHVIVVCGFIRHSQAIMKQVQLRIRDLHETKYKKIIYMFPEGRMRDNVLELTRKDMEKPMLAVGIGRPDEFSYVEDALLLDPMIEAEWDKKLSYITFRLGKQNTKLDEMEENLDMQSLRGKVCKVRCEIAARECFNYSKLKCEFYRNVLDTAEIFL